ncbi:hypothetical protein JHK82_048261 [Glycine max]|nr:hypothetical protein JHK82_048261 [Glycine max]
MATSIGLDRSVLMPLTGFHILYRCLSEDQDTKASNPATSNKINEAQLTPLPSLVAPSSLVQQPFSLDAPPTHFNGLLVEFLNFYLTN